MMSEDWMKELVAEIHELRVSIRKLTKEIERLKYSVLKYSDRIEALNVWVDAKKHRKKAKLTPKPRLYERKLYTDLRERGEN